MAETSIESADLPQRLSLSKSAEPTPVETPLQVQDLERLKLEPPEERFVGFNTFAFSPDGRRVVGATTNSLGGHALYVWNAETGEPLDAFGNFKIPEAERTFVDDDGDKMHRPVRVNWLKFSDDGTRLAAAIPEFGRVKVWDVAEKRLLQSVKLDQPVHTYNNLFPRVAFSPDGKTLAVLSQEIISIGKKVVRHGRPNGIRHGGRLTVYDVDSGEERWSLDDSNLECIAMLADGSGLAGISTDIVNVKMNEEGNASWRPINETLKIFDLQTGDVTAQTKHVPFRPNVLVSVPGTADVVGRTSSGIAVIGLPDADVRQSFSWHEDRWACDVLKFSQDGKRIARSWNDYAEVVNLETGDVEYTLLAEFPNSISAVGFSPDLRRIACELDGPVILQVPVDSTADGDTAQRDNDPQ